MPELVAVGEVPWPRGGCQANTSQEATRKQHEGPYEVFDIVRHTELDKERSSSNIYLAKQKVDPCAMGSQSC